MRILGSLFIVAVAMLLPVLMGSTVLAKPVSVNGGQIKVQAEVLPAHKIIVDDTGMIIRIFSNTTEDIPEPRVFQDSLESTNERPLSEEIRKEYSRLVPSGKSRIGVLYDRNSILLLTTLNSEVSALTLFRMQSNNIAFDLSI